MTIDIRRDHEISDVDGDWFRARWHFSFDSYYDPAWVQFGTLRVFNDDRLIPGAIWPLHPHRDIEGLFRHEDDHGGAPGPLPAGSVQRMTLGSGAWHSEQNASETEPMRFIQMWIMPAQQGLEPNVEQKVFTMEDRTDELLKVISGDGGDAVLVHQDANIYISRMNEAKELQHSFESDQGAYLYVIDGSLELNDENLETGDAAKIEGEREVRLRAADATEVIIVEVRVSA